jgi:hypothetical protein
MRATVHHVVLGGLLIAQPLLPPGPSLEEATAVWTGFWTAVAVGDSVDAGRYVHSQRRHLFPGPHRPDELQAMATQMAYCRLDPNPRPVGPDEVIYRVLCQRGDETAESQVGLRRDHDGAWRLSVL